MITDNITTIDTSLYDDIAEYQHREEEVTLSFNEPRSQEFWQEFNDKILRTLGNAVELRLHDRYQPDLSFLQWLSDLQVLKIACYRQPDLDKLPPMDKLNELLIGFPDWKPFSASLFPKFKNLTSLITLGGAMTDTHYITTMNKLTSLCLTYTEGLLDYGFLRDMQGLKYLAVKNHEQVTDLSPIGELKNLPFLQLYNLTSLENIDFVAGMSNLVYLHATLPALKAFPDLSANDNLTKLVLMEVSEHTDIAKVASLQNLEELSVYESYGSGDAWAKVIEQLPKLRVGYFDLEDEDMLKIDKVLKAKGVITKNEHGKKYQALFR